MNRKFGRTCGASLFVKLWIMSIGVLCSMSLYAASVSLQLTTGWNLLGNSLSEPLAVTALGDATTVGSVWQWNSERSSWRFYSPALAPDGLKSYAASKGYEVLTMIDPGQGFWVNAKKSATLPAQTGVEFELAAAQLRTGWNLAANGSALTPQALSERLAAERIDDPVAGAQTLRVTSLWAWDAASSRWYFFSPQLAATALSGYVKDKGYLDFVQNGKTLLPGMGFWLNAARSSAQLLSLTVSKNGTGTGAIVSTPAGIDCGGVCTHGFATDTEVTLTAAPGADSGFDGWSGACQGAAKCVVKLTAAKSVGASFSKGPMLSIRRACTGQGMVTSAPTGIDCGGTCAQGFAKDATVVLTAQPAAGSAFTHWSGDCQGATIPTYKPPVNTPGVIIQASVSSTPVLKDRVCTVKNDRVRELGVCFVAGYVLSIAKEGEGNGRIIGGDGVTSVDCSATCAESYPKSASITLSAGPDKDSYFVGWSGACSGTDKCTLTMDAAKSVTAKFAPRPKLTVKLIGDGAGEVLSDYPLPVQFSKIVCGDLCTSTAGSLGRTMVLTAKARIDSTFAGWSGACQGSATTCSVALEGDKTVEAKFDKRTDKVLLRVSLTGGFLKGVVTSEPVGIRCPDTTGDGLNNCEQPFLGGSSVRLIATPDNFLGWSGDCSGNIRECWITMDTAKNVVANYGAPPKPDPVPDPNPSPNPNPTPSPTPTPDVDGCFKVDPPKLTVTTSRMTGNWFCPDCLKVTLSNSTKRIYADVCIVNGAKSDCISMNVLEGDKNFHYSAGSGYTVKYVGSTKLYNDWNCIAKSELVQTR